MNTLPDGVYCAKARLMPNGVYCAEAQFRAFGSLYKRYEVTLNVAKQH